MNKFQSSWLLLVLGGVLLEGIALGTNHSEYTLSYQLRALRFDPIGRYAVLIFFSWFLIHIVIQPKWLGTRTDWRGAIGLAVGLAWAIVETVRAAR